MDVSAGKAMLGHVVDALGDPIDGKWALNDHQRLRNVNLCMNPCKQVVHLTKKKVNK